MPFCIQLNTFPLQTYDLLWVKYIFLNLETLVIGVPIKSRNSIDGWDSVLSILQMPGGVPVATVALNGAKNAGILAAQIIGVDSLKIQKKIINYKEELSKNVLESSKKLGD